MKFEWALEIQEENGKTYRASDRSPSPISALVATYEDAYSKGMMQMLPRSVRTKLAGITAQFLGDSLERHEKSLKRSFGLDLDEIKTYRDCEIYNGYTTEWSDEHPGCVPLMQPVPIKLFDKEIRLKVDHPNTQESGVGVS